MVSPEWENRDRTDQWQETSLTDERAADGDEEYERNIQAVAARIDRFSQEEATALALYYVTVDELSEDIAIQLVTAFGHRSKTGIARWLKEQGTEQTLIPFNAYLHNAPEFDTNQKKFVADTIADSITYADQRRYMSIMLDPSSIEITDPAQAAIAEQTANDLSRELIENRSTLAESLILADQDNYLNAINELEKGTDRMDDLTNENAYDEPEPADDESEEYDEPEKRDEDKFIRGTPPPNPYDQFMASSNHQDN